MMGKLDGKAEFTQGYLYTSNLDAENQDYHPTHEVHSATLSHDHYRCAFLNKVAYTSTNGEMLQPCSVICTRSDLLRPRESRLC